MNEQKSLHPHQHLHISAKRVIREHVVKNLLSAQEQAAKNGDSKGAIRLAKYLLYLADQFGNVLIDVEPREGEKKETAADQTAALLQYIREHDGRGGKEG